MPSVSVVISLYNACGVILGMIRRVLAQTWKDYESVVVEDVSAGGSGDVVNAFGPARRSILQEDGGVARAKAVQQPRHVAGFQPLFGESR